VKQPFFSSDLWPDFGVGRIGKNPSKKSHDNNKKILGKTIAKLP
jgi:hypothetical protein